ATLLPLRLIEHRYGLPAFVMLLVCREDDPPAVEYAGVALGALLSGAAVYVLARGLWLLYPRIDRFVLAPPHPLVHGPLLGSGRPLRVEGHALERPPAAHAAQSRHAAEQPVLQRL